MLNKEMSAETTAEKSKNADATNVSPAIGNTNVVSRFLSPENEAKHEKILQIMYGNSCLEILKSITKPEIEYKHAVSNYDYVIDKMIDSFKNQLRNKVAAYFISEENFDKRIIISLESKIALVFGQ